MKNLLFSSFLAISICSCTLGHYKRLTPLPADTTVPVLKPIFGDHFNSFLFKTNLRLYGNDFSGLLITKQMKPADYRVVFTTELGMKLFDFEFTDTAFILHYCVPRFNRPSILKIIQQDIEILLMSQLQLKPVHQLSDKQNLHIVHKIVQDKFTNYYFIEKSSLHLLKIEHAKKQSKRTTFTFDQYTENIPGRIQIQHHDLKLTIELTLLKK